MKHEVKHVHKLFDRAAFVTDFRKDGLCIGKERCNEDNKYTYIHLQTSTLKQRGQINVFTGRGYNTQSCIINWLHFEPLKGVHKKIRHCHKACASRRIL